MEWIAGGIVVALIVGGAIASRIWAARRLKRHLDGMQAAEAAKAEARRRARETPRQ